MLLQLTFQFLYWISFLVLLSIPDGSIKFITSVFKQEKRNGIMQLQKTHVQTNISTHTLKIIDLTSPDSRKATSAVLWCHGKETKEWMKRKLNNENNPAHVSRQCTSPQWMKKRCGANVVRRWAMEKTWLFRVDRGLYYPVMWGIMINHGKNLIKQPV